MELIRSLFDQELQILHRGFLVLDPGVSELFRAETLGLLEAVSLHVLYRN